MKTRLGKITAVMIVLLMAVVTGWVAYLAAPAMAAVTTQNEAIVTHPDIKSYTYVYVQIWSFDGTYVYDTEANSAAGGWTAIGSATYANTDIEIVVNADYYVGALKLPTNIRSKRIVVRVMGSADATPDKNDTQITAYAMYYDVNGWSKWPGPDAFSY
jgi:hypothetical protein